jgi:hypothetical protein
MGPIRHPICHLLANNGEPDPYGYLYVEACNEFVDFRVCQLLKANR